MRRLPPTLVVGCVLVGLVIVAPGCRWSGRRPTDARRGRRALQEPGRRLRTGTDNLGRDVLSA